MAKETFYFTHDYGSRNDPELQKVLMKCGMDGIGTYWCLIEMLYENQGRLLLSEIETYAFALRVHCDVIKTLIDDTKLFEKSGEFFYSNSVLRRLEERDSKSKKARKSAYARWRPTK